MAVGLDLLIDRSDLYDTTVEPSNLSDDSVPQSGEALLRVDCFGLSANNITYAALGDSMRYWEFFPARDGYGRMPVWGFADVVASAADGVETGRRYYGYYPPSTHVLVRPGRVSPSGFVDESPHRSSLPAVYNRYVDTVADAAYDARHEGLIALLRPLYATAFLLDDYFDDNGHFGADGVVVTSASSKTAFMFADLMNQRADRPALIGLTSPSNVGFVEDLGTFDRVLDYSAVATLPRSATAIVDFAGDAAVADGLHEHLGEAVTHSAVVGMTHFRPDDAVDGAAALSDPRRTFFFAPDQMVKRTKDWGPGAVVERSGRAWGPMAERSLGRLDLVHGHGPESVRRVYEELIRGSTSPRTGHVVSMWGDD